MTLLYVDNKKKIIVIKDNIPVYKQSAGHIRNWCKEKNKLALCYPAKPRNWYTIGMYCFFYSIENHFQRLTNHVVNNGQKY